MLDLGFPLVFRRLVTSTLFKVFRLFFIAIQKIAWNLNGTASRIREIRSDKRLYDQSAQVVDIVAFKPFCLLRSYKMNNFIYTHNRFENPQYVIDNDNVSLYKIEANRVIFVEARDKDMLLWKSEYSSFLRLAQLTYGVRFIFVPLYAFHRMSDAIGDPKATITFLINTGRCGSTLMNQVMEYTERCVSTSEPQSVDCVAMKFQREGDNEEVRRLARDATRWECRPYKSMVPPPLGYFLKIAAPSACILPILNELFPSSRNLFMYRDILTVSKSVYRASFAMPSLYVARVLGRFSGAATSHLIDEMGWPGNGFNYRCDNNLVIGTLVSAVTMKTYKDMRRMGFPIKAFRYEELVARPLETCRCLMEYCGLPVELAELAVRGLKVDSQRNSPLAQNLIGSIPVPQVTDEVKASLNRILAKFELPLLNEESLLEGTLMVNA